MTHIKRIRLKLGISQDQFAHLANVHQSTVSRWERGLLQPSWDDLVQILKAAAGRLQPHDMFPTPDTFFPPDTFSTGAA